MVNSVETTLKNIVVHAGYIVQEIGADGPGITVRFKGPAVNIFGVYQHRV